MKSAPLPAERVGPPVASPDAALRASRRDALDLDAIFRAHANFIWLSLQRLGVQHADLDDVAQDVFVIVHRRLDRFDGSSLLTTWLFGICLRVAANYRRKRRFLLLPTGIIDDAALATDPHQDLARREAQRHLERILARMDVAKRAVFVMFEWEGISCDEIARTMGVPVGTVFSRLHAARREFNKTLARSRKG
jgi:RNA polymerase sigma-70 factor (ECF subfamily)